MSETKKAVVIKVNDKSLSVMGFDRENDLYSVSYAEDGNNKFKQGQEILIYFNGIVAETFPSQIGNVGKIEIIKEKSDKAIPEDIIRFYYNYRDKVKTTISELTNSGITLTITDTNEIPYDYSDKYVVNKKVKNKDYKGIGYKIGEDTGNSVSGYTRNRSRIYMGRSK